MARTTVLSKLRAMMRGALLVLALFAVRWANADERRSITEVEYIGLKYQSEVQHKVGPRWRDNVLDGRRARKAERTPHVTTVDVEISETGDLVGVKIVAGCGVEAWDQAVVAAFETGSLPPPPARILDRVTNHATLLAMKFTFTPSSKKRNSKFVTSVGSVPKGLELVSDGRWREATSPHFQIVGNGSREEIRGLAEEFERVRALLRSSLPENSATAEPVVPVTVFAVQTTAEFMAFAPSVFETRDWNPSGIFRAGTLGVDIFVHLDDRRGLGNPVEDAGPTIRHEYHHFYLDRTSPWAPVCLREGLADLWAGASVDHNMVRLGAVDDLKVRHLRASKLFPIADLLRVRRDSPEYRNKELARTFYAESFLLAHFLLFEPTEGEEKLRAFGELVKSGVPPEEAAKRVWGDLARLQVRLEEYINKGNFRATRRPITEAIPDLSALEVREIPDSRAIAVRAWLLAVDSHKDEAREAAEAALSIDPNDTVALEAKGYLKFFEGDRETANALLSRAAAQPDARFSAHFLVAITSKNRDAKAEEHLDQALSLAPRFSRALVAKAIFRVATDSNSAVTLAERAIEIDPSDAIVALRAARVFRKAKNPERANQLVKHAVELAVARGNVHVNAEVCLLGALDGTLTLVGESCETAVRLGPRETEAYAARAVYRSLTNDRAGARADLQWLTGNAKPARAREGFRRMAERLASDRMPTRDDFRSLEDSLL